MTPIFQDALNELARARRKFPSSDICVTAFSEEAGELVRAVLQHYAGVGSLADVRKEAVQVIAMVLRVLYEGDAVHRLPPIEEEVYLIREVTASLGATAIIKKLATAKNKELLAKSLEGLADCMECLTKIMEVYTSKEESDET